MHGKDGKDGVAALALQILDNLNGHGCVMLHLIATGRETYLYIDSQLVVQAGELAAVFLFC